MDFEYVLLNSITYVNIFEQEQMYKMDKKTSETFYYHCVAIGCDCRALIKRDQL